MATTRINAVSATATTFAGDDFLPIDGNVNATRRILVTSLFASASAIGSVTPAEGTFTSLSGTNINGTLGATTPSSVAATTGTFSSTLGVTGVATLGNGAILGTPASGNLASCTGYVGTSALVTVGALNSGSITSGFGSIDVGADAISGGAGTLTQLTVNGTGSVRNTFTINGASSDAVINPRAASGYKTYIQLTEDSIADRWAIGTNNGDATLYFKTGNFAGTTVGTFTSTGLNSTAIGATTPAAGSFTTVDSSGVISSGTNSRVGVNINTGQVYFNNTDVGVWRGASNSLSTGAYLNLGGYDGMTMSVGAAAIGSKTKILDVSSTGLAVTGVLSCTNIFTQSTNDQSTSRLRLINTGSGGQTWDIIGGTNGVSNAGLGFLNGSTTYMQLTTAGAAITGTLSATGAIGCAGLTSTNTNIIITGNDQSINRLRFVNTGTGGEDWNIVGGQPNVDNTGLSFHYNPSGSAIMVLKTTGLAVASALSATGNITIASASNQKVSVQITDSGNDRNAELELLSSGNGGSEAKITFGDTDTTPGTPSPLCFYGYHSGVATKRMTITSTGLVGIGTTSPGQLLHIQDATSYTALNVKNNKGSAGGTSVIQFGLNDGSFDTPDAARIEARIIDNPHSALDFKIYNNTGAGQTIMSIVGTGSTGSVGIGTTDPTGSYLAKFASVSTSASNYAGVFYVNAASSDSIAAIQMSKSTNVNTSSQVFSEFYINAFGTASGRIVANGASAAAFASYSDKRLKENITDLPSQLNNILSLRPVEFDFKDGSGHQIGFIAQEVEEVYPDLIAKGKDDMLTLTGLSKNEARLIKAIQEQNAQIESLSARLAALESK